MPEDVVVGQPGCSTTIKGNHMGGGVNGSGEKIGREGPIMVNNFMIPKFFG